MTTLRDLLTELRAIRIGIQYWLQAATGKQVDLLAEATRAAPWVSKPPLGKSRQTGVILHRNPERLKARELLTEMGDDTELMLEWMREHVSEEAAAGARKFYEDEILRGKNGGRQ